jgi:hypothetical protein
VCFSPITHVCLAHFSHYLISRKCMLFPYHICVSCSRFLASSSLACVCFSTIAHVCLAHFSCPHL